MNEGRCKARFASTARSKGGNVNYQLLWIVCPSSNADVETYFPQCDIIRRLGPLGSLPESLLQDLFQNLVYQALWLQGGSLLASPGSAPVCLGSAEL